MIPESPIRVITLTGVGTVRVTGPWALGSVDRWSDDGDDRGFVQWTSGSLTKWIWMIVTTVVYDGTSTSSPYESGYDGGDPELLSGWSTGSGVV